MIIILNNYSPCVFIEIATCRRAFFVFMIANLYLLYCYFCVILQGMGMIDKDITSLHTLCRQFDVSVQLHTITEVMSFLVHLSQHLLQRTGNHSNYSIYCSGQVALSFLSLPNDNYNYQL